MTKKVEKKTPRQIQHTLYNRLVGAYPDFLKMDEVGLSYYDTSESGVVSEFRLSVYTDTYEHPVRGSIRRCLSVIRPDLYRYIVEEFNGVLGHELEIGSINFLDLIHYGQKKCD